MTEVNAFSQAILKAYELLQISATTDPSGDSLFLYWKARLFDGGGVKETELNQFTLEEILDDVIYCNVGPDS